MQREALDQAWQTYRRSAFRMEARQTYAVPQETEAWQAFIEGRLMPPRTPENNPWLHRVASHTAEGRRIYRVHIVDLPLSPYVQFEMHGYRDNAAAGELIYIANRSDHLVLADYGDDWWLFDDTRLVLMHYNDAGEFLAAEDAPQGTDIGEYRRRRDLALQHALPLNDYLYWCQEFSNR